MGSGSGKRRYSGRPRGIPVRGDVLRRARESRHVTREELAELTLLSTKTIQKAEGGGPVSPRTARELARCFELPLASVLQPDLAGVHQRLVACGRAPSPPPERWVPREAEAATLIGWLTPEAHTAGEELVCAIAGPAGVGKTALARWVSSELEERFPEGVVWVDAGADITPEQLHSARWEIADALGFGGEIPDLDSAGEDAVRLAFRRHFWGRERLLVIDDVRSSSLPECFLSLREPCIALITTRHRSIAESCAARLLELRGLPTEAARRVLESWITRARLDADAEGTDRLLRLLDGTPRGLNMAGRTLQKEIFTSPGAYAGRLWQGSISRRSTEALVSAGRTWEADGARPLRAFVDLQRSLTQGAFSLFGHLGAFEEQPFSIDQAAAAADLDEARAARYLAELADTYLVEEVAADELPNGPRRAGTRLRVRRHAVWMARRLWALNEM